MLITNILLGMAAFILFMFIVGETKPPMNEEKRRTLTITLASLLAFALLINTIV